MQRKESAERMVSAAARRFARHLRAANGGTKPRSEAAWRRLARSYEIYAAPLKHCPKGFEARLWYDEEFDQWFIAYNPNAPLRQRCRFICHEIAEFLAVNDFPSLFDNLPDLHASSGNGGAVYYYTGGDDPYDLRHRIARRVEELCFRKR